MAFDIFTLKMFAVLLASAAVSYYAVRWVYFKVLKIATIKNLVDVPDYRKLQKSPVPVLGGIAVFFGLLFGLMFSGVFLHEYSILLPPVLASVVMLYVGSLDDILSLSPRVRIIIEILVLLGMILASGFCVDSLHGLWGVGSFTWWVAIPISVFAGVGIINAYNMVDGVNGLSSGLCIMASSIIAVFFWKRSEFADCAMSLCFCASLIPFFIHNVFGKTSRMFIGDGGTMVMGTIVSWFVMRVMSSTQQYNIHDATGINEMCLAAMLVSVASVPVFDTLRVMFLRIAKGQSPFSADKTHLHHAFIDAGASHLTTTICEITINILVILSWYVSYKMGMALSVQLYITLIVSIIFVWGSYLLLVSRGSASYIKKIFGRISDVAGSWDSKFLLSVQEYLDSKGKECCSDK